MKFTSAIECITSNSKFILTAHETPDGDAIGSECALYFVLKKLGKEVYVFNADPMPKKFRYLDPDGVIQTLTSIDLLPENIEEFVLIMLDVNDTNNIGQVSELILPKVKRTFIIDHHENGETVVTSNLVQEGASSTCEILYEVFEELDIDLDFMISIALYTGIVYDTGSFIYPKTTAKTFLIAHNLVLNGVEPNDVYARIYESNSISSLVLQSRVLSTLKLYYDEHVAVQIMRKAMIEECNAHYEEADALINIPLKSEDIRVSVFFKENMEGILRCSLRSKGNIDVVEIAQKFGGGGHKTAAGFKCKESLENTQKIVLEDLAKYFNTQ